MFLCVEPIEKQKFRAEVKLSASHIVLVTLSIFRAATQWKTRFSFAFFLFVAFRTKYKYIYSSHVMCRRNMINVE